MCECVYIVISSVQIMFLYFKKFKKKLPIWDITIYGYKCFYGQLLTRISSDQTYVGVASGVLKITAFRTRDPLVWKPTPQPPLSLCKYSLFLLQFSIPLRLTSSVNGDEKKKRFGVVTYAEWYQNYIRWYSATHPIPPPPYSIKPSDPNGFIT